MSDPRAHVIYTKLLLRRGHGYPLWIPESDDNLPDVYRNKGVTVGDLGILTDDGGFDFLFNVCAEADDPVNQGHVPPLFQPLQISSSHTIRKIPFHRKKSSITSAHVSKTTVAVEGSAEMTSFVAGGGGFEFSTSKAEAAILMLPDGGSSLFHLAREAPNGSLYLVTGCDKARSWMTAAASRSSESHAISVKFAIGPVMEGRIALQTSWSTPYVDADTRIYPDYPEPMPEQGNQCVFMRGFTITVRENSFIQKVLGPVQLKVIGGSSRDVAPSFSSRSPYSSYQGNTTGSSSSGVSSSMGPVDNLVTPDYLKNEDPNSLLEDDIELMDLPGQSIENPYTSVAVTHDEDWMEVTKDLSPDEWPNDFKLSLMVLDLFEKRLTESLVFNDQQPLAGLNALNLSRPTSTQEGTADDKQQRRGRALTMPMPKREKRTQTFKERLWRSHHWIREAETAWRAWHEEQKSKGLDDDDIIRMAEKRLEEMERMILEVEAAGKALDEAQIKGVNDEDISRMTSRMVRVKKHLDETKDKMRLEAEQREALRECEAMWKCETMKERKALNERLLKSGGWIRKAESAWRTWRERVGTGILFNDVVAMQEIAQAKKRLEEMEHWILEVEAAGKTWDEAQIKGVNDEDVSRMTSRMVWVKVRLDETKNKTSQEVEEREAELKRMGTSARPGESARPGTTGKTMAGEEQSVLVDDSDSSRIPQTRKGLGESEPTETAWKMGSDSVIAAE
ncbi:hypothetical protein IW261DRAFT_1593374 [Armillaria novae-zelandiae]|uniref:Uncharacterized protein n=1 Tax=Armillaria novae-zelandiae TaxID=153914 RepID=A0AA39PA91_9AGAR|nr:hypothetical protein IW261DRAFT_1593374 [Armillaria novae-zelandiae]